MTHALRVACLIALPALLASCDDPLAPDVRSLLRSPVMTDEERREVDIAELFGLWLEYLPMLPSTQIAVEVDGEWLGYRAHVFEIAFVPDTGHYDSVTRGRRQLRAWRSERGLEAFALGGGLFPGRVGPYYRDDEPDWRGGLRPWTVMYHGNGQPIRGVAGEADLQRLGTGDECPWNWQVVPGITPRDTTWHGYIRCEYANYAVTAWAELSDWDYDARKPKGRRTSLRLMTHRVPGFLITILCDNSPMSENLGCGEWTFAPACAGANPRRPSDCDLPNRDTLKAVGGPGVDADSVPVPTSPGRRRSKPPEVDPSGVLQTSIRRPPRLRSRSR